MIATGSGNRRGLIVSPADVEAIRERADRCAALTNATLARAAAYLEGREQARRFYYLNTARKIVKLPFAELNAAHTPNAPARDGRGRVLFPKTLHYGNRIYYNFTTFY